MSFRCVSFRSFVHFFAFRNISFRFVSFRSLRFDFVSFRTTLICFAESNNIVIFRDVFHIGLIIGPRPAVLA
jgi:hypothetical protein